MADYEISPAAERDLLEIALYTIQTWALRQAKRYEAAFEGHFAAIGRGELRSRTFLEHRPELHVAHCEHHYVFFLQREDTCPLILAVFHEKMDLMTRLQDRLESQG